jgi:hypothetical protein
MKKRGLMAAPQTGRGTSLLVPNARAFERARLQPRRQMVLVEEPGFSPASAAEITMGL